MPARVSSRSARMSAVAAGKLRVPSTRGSTASRVSTPNIEIPEETEATELRTQICTIFRDAQKTTATHRKLVITLRKIQEACAYEPTSQNKNKTGAEEFDEEDFNYEVRRCVLRVMPVKKSEGAGEKVVKFLGLFLRHATEKDNELIPADDEDETGVMVETPSTRLTTQVLSAVLPLLTSKDKFVRYRSTQLISHIINSLDAIDDDLFQSLRRGLLKRIRDKEAMVRVQAVLGLGGMAGNEADDEGNSDDSEDEGGAGLLLKLLDILQNDPSADVRRALLTNLPILPKTLPFLLERARDQDPATRRILYSRVLPTLGDFRFLSLSMREKLLRWGLRDRDDTVRKAAGKLFRERWIEDCAGTEAAENGETDALGEPVERGPSIDGLLELLERIDIVNSGVENGVAIEAMKGFWEGRQDYREAVIFDALYWDTLSAESVFVVRSWNDFCRDSGSRKLESLMEDKMPEVTKLAFYVRRYVDVLVDALKRVATQEVGEDEEEEDTVEQEFIVEQLLQIAKTQDYSDEVGRREMFNLCRHCLRIPDLPEEVTKLVVELLRGICPPDAAGEKEFCSVVLEGVADVHDTIMDEPDDEGNDSESFHSARSEVSDDEAEARAAKKIKKEEGQDDEEKAVREIMVNMKCLHMVQCMLENVEGTLQQNPHLVAMLNNLVVPAVRSHEAPIRERGLLCLGLCALLDKSLAEENLTLFMHFFNKGHATLQITALQIITDILNQHGAQLIETNPALLKVFIKALKSGSKSAEVQAAATISVSKLLLGRVIQDPAAIAELLKTLIVAFFDPSTAGNQGVRQTLTYFLPVYSYSRKENQDRIRSVALDSIHALYNVRENLDDEDEDDEMVTLSTIGALLVDWTDPRKCYVPGDQVSVADESKKAVNGDVHLDFANDILEKLAGSITREEKKSIAPLLGKLHVSPASTEEKLRELKEECEAAIADKRIPDATGNNALLKFHISIGKIVNSLGETSTRRGSVMPGSARSSVAPESRRGSLAPESRRGSVAPSEMSAVEEEPDKMDISDAPEDSEDEGTVIAKKEDDLVSELLSDDEDEEML